MDNNTNDDFNDDLNDLNVLLSNLHVFLDDYFE